MNDDQSSTVPNTSRALEGLQNQDIHGLVSTFVQSNAAHPLVQDIVSHLDRIAAKADLQRLIAQLLSTLTDRQFYDGLTIALKTHIEAHPWQTAFFVIGIVLLCNPLTMAGFGSLGPVAGKFMVSSAHFTESLI